MMSRRRLLLSVQGGTGGCADTDRESDIELDECALASVYLGGNRFLSLRDAMRLRELRSGACAQADTMFRAEREPWCSYEF
jgi:hypothetical protein